jgi:N-carbamoylputrescine amidase
LTALRGAQILLYPTAIGWHPAEKAEHGPGQQQAWELIQRSHALANGVYVAAVNRVGHEGAPGGGLEFWGHSFVCDPFGGLTRVAAGDAEEVLIVPCDPRRLEDIRRHWPFLRDRRIDAYADMTRRLID